MKQSLAKATLTGMIILAAFQQAAHAQAGKNLHILSTYHIASNGGWDYIAVQPNSNRIFVSHGTQVNVLDKHTGDSLGYIPNTQGVHGIAFVPALNKGYTSNGRAGNATVFNLKTLAVTGTVKTGENPDAIFYDAHSKKIVICNGRSKDLTFIDPATDQVVATVPVGGKPETAVSNEAGKIYVNVEDKNEIVVVNAATYKVEAHWSLLPGEAPTGLAIDTKTKRLFAACGDNKLLVVMNAENGAVVAKLPIGDGCDGDCFDPQLHNIYTSNGEGSITVIHEDSKDQFTVTANVPTKKSARTIALDEATHKLYLPAADVETQAPGATGRPRMKPGSFQVLVVGN